MQKLYANSEKQDLVKHLFAVGSVASLLSAQLVANNPKLSNTIFIAGCLHDIGKVDPAFQQFLLKKTKKKKDFFELHPTHNELSLLLYHLLNDLQAKPTFSKKLIKHVLYWHHAKPRRENKFEKIKCIYKRVKKELNNLLKSAETVLVELNQLHKIDGLQIQKFDPIDLDINLPQYKQYEIGTELVDYVEDVSLNTYNSFARACVITADRLVSALSSDELDNIVAAKKFETIVAKAFKHTSNLGTNIQICLDGFNKNVSNEQRNISQHNIAKKLSCSNDIAVLSGAAGCGKTKVALEWANLTKAKKIIWICPRVQVCEGLLLDLTSNEYLPNAKIEICTGSLKFIQENGIKTETPENKNFSGDIVLTTIDQVVGSIVTHRNVTSLIDFMASHIVFDEYHEYVNMNTFNLLFAELIKCKELREDQTKTLLVSATPHYTYLEELLNIDKCSIETLDSFNTNEYKISYQGFDEKNKDNNPLFSSQIANTIVISNTATTAQKSFILNQDIENGVLLHSKFTNNDRKNLFKEIFNSFKQNGNHKYSILRSGPIVQAALNITCKHMVSELTSPDNMLQRLGRLNRFGENTGVSEYMIAIPNNFLNNKGSKCTSFLAQLNLLNSAAAWYTFLKQCKIFNQKTTIKELYALYYEFHKSPKGSEAIKKDLDKALQQSVKTISEKLLDPIKFNSKNSKKRKISKSSLRGSSRFVQLAICEATALQKQHLDQYACSPNNTMTYPLEYLYSKDSSKDIIDFMARKHHMILKAQGQKVTSIFKFKAKLEQMSVDEEKPIYTSYTQQDLDLLGHYNKPCPGAIYYVITPKQPVGAMTNKNLEDIYI